MPELLQLYLTFARIGLVNFGGGYAMLPLLERELVNDRGWCTRLCDLSDHHHTAHSYVPDELCGSPNR